MTTTVCKIQDSVATGTGNPAKMLATEDQQTTVATLKDIADGKSPITPSVGIRLVLDQAETVEDAIDIFESHNFFADGDSSAKSYHFIVGDATGHTALIEYIRPNDEGEWEMNVLDGQDYATNMYMSEGWETFGVDKDFSKQYSFEL
ncbi:MAG: carcinine hydrolase/isopenicillin-N N-acyltransferase family protein [Fibrobacter sp.]|nr:carcinine hydrolase/isopenicillin-N N-acyltransferase family protein [Fibrobacter sp.]